jgi:DNA-binding IclR family transcriptional regulator
MSLGTSVPGAAALAILLPVPRDHDPLALSIGGPVKEIQRDRARLVRLLREAVEPLNAAVGRL